MERKIQHVDERNIAKAYVNRIATSVPPNDMHLAFVKYACAELAADSRQASLFARLVQLGGIEHRYSFLKPASDLTGSNLDDLGFYRRGAFPTTATRMRQFETLAPRLANEAIDKLDLGSDRAAITHLIISCCTGCSAPGIDLQILESQGFSPSVERTMVGFMGCYAAMNGLKLARHIVRSESHSKVLLLNLELCTLHFADSLDLEQILSFLLFSDGCAASLITAEPTGLALDRFQSVVAPNTRDLITWNIGDTGFDMKLSGRVPAAIRETLCANTATVLAGHRVEDVDLWAIHPGGRTVLDAVQTAMDLPADALWASREVLRDYGNMSSATVMFVMKRLMETMKPKQLGCGMAFGPGLVAETMLFHSA